MVGVLEYDIGARGRRMPDDAFVKGVVPQRRGLDDESRAAQRFRHRFEASLVAIDDLFAGLLQGRRIEQPLATEILIVIANE